MTKTQSGEINSVPPFCHIYQRHRDSRLFERFFYGFTSSEGSPSQLFFPGVTDRLILFPTGMIPLFLVPYAIFIHVLSLLNYLMFQRSKGRDTGNCSLARKYCC